MSFITRFLNRIRGHRQGPVAPENRLAVSTATTSKEPTIQRPLDLAKLRRKAGHASKSGRRFLRIPGLTVGQTAAVCMAQQAIERGHPVPRTWFRREIRKFINTELRCRND